MTINCCDCHKSLEKAAFAKAQLKKPSSQRRCRLCASKREQSSSEQEAAKFDVSKPPCAAQIVGCTVKQATLTCSACKSVSYCSAACQRKHWPQHKLVCAHVEKHRGHKVSRKVLRQKVCKPWTRRTTYEQKDTDFNAFERTFEKYIARLAAQHRNDQDAGFVLVDISVMSHPLNLRWCRFKDVNKRGEPKLSRNVSQECLDGFDPNTMYIAMGIYGGKSGIQYERDSTWMSAPIQVFSYGGRGSSYYQGPGLGFQGFLNHMMTQQEGNVSKDAVQSMLDAGVAAYPTEEAQLEAARQSAREWARKGDVVDESTL